MNELTSKFKFSLNKKNIFLGVFVLWGILFILSFFSGESVIRGLNLFENGEGKEYLFRQYILDLSLYSCGNLIIFVLPGLIWFCNFYPKKVSISKLLFFSFLTSLCLLILGTTIYKLLFTGHLDGFNFLVIVTGITVSGLIWLLFKRNYVVQTFSFSSKNICFLAIFSSVAFLFGWLFQDKIIWVEYGKNFSPEYVLSLPLGMQGDLMEHFGLVDSLKSHLLPYWDLEYGNKFGYSVIDPPLHTFVSLFLILFFGHSFAVQSLNTILVIVLNYWMVLKIVQSDTRQEFKFIPLVIFPLFCSYMFIILFHPESSVVLSDHIHYMTFFTVAQLYFLSKRNNVLFLIFAVLAFLTKYEAFIFTFLGLMFYQIIYNPNKGYVGKLFRKYLCFVLPYIILFIVIGFQYNNLKFYMESLIVERFIRIDHFSLLDRIYPQSVLLWDSFSWMATGIFMKEFILSTCLLGCLIFIPHKDKRSLLFQGVAISYFIFVFISRVKRLHYISPLVFLSLVVALRAIMDHKIILMREKRPSDKI